MNKFFRIAVASLVAGFAIGSCKADPLIFPEPSGSTGSSSSASVSSSSSAESSASSSGQGSGGSGSGLSCDPCESIDGSRLVRQRTKLVGTDGLVFYFGLPSIYDTVENTVCSSSIAEDGVLRCIPYGMANIGNHFSDSACTIPLAFSFANACSNSIPKYAGEVVAGSSCNDPNKFVIYKVTSEFAGQLYTKSNNTCTSATPLPNYKYLTIGNKVAPSTFVQVDIQTIP